MQTLNLGLICEEVSHGENGWPLLLVSDSGQHGPVLHFPSVCKIADKVVDETGQEIIFCILVP